MKFRKILSALALTTLLSFSSGCSDQNQVLTIESEQRNAINKQADEILSKMTLEDKVGQILWLGIHGSTYDDILKIVLETYKPGGIILSERSCESVDQVKQLTRDLQQNSKYPLLIAIDEEGGKYNRAQNIIEPPPSQKEIGDSGNPELAKEWAIKNSKNLKELGINVNFAPVLDVGYNDPDGRCYSSDPEIVTKFAKSAIDGYASENFLCTLKHFPGIGHSVGEAELGLSDVHVPEKILKSTDLLPFKEVTYNYPEETFFVMTSPAKYPSLDSDHSANVSKKIITDLLRNEMEYNGVVITGNFDMAAVSQTISFRDAGVQSILAGCDVVFIVHSYEYGREVYNGILDGVKSGKISEDRINESVRRILRAKIYSNLFPKE